MHVWCYHKRMERPTKRLYIGYLSHSVIHFPSLDVVLWCTGVFSAWLHILARCCKYFPMAKVAKRIVMYFENVVGFWDEIPGHLFNYIRSKEIISITLLTLWHSSHYSWHNSQLVHCVLPNLIHAGHCVLLWRIHMIHDVIQADFWSFYDYCASQIPECKFLFETLKKSNLYAFLYNRACTCACMCDRMCQTGTKQYKCKSAVDHTITAFPFFIIWIIKLARTLYLWWPHSVFIHRLISNLFSPRLLMTYRAVY